MDLQDHSPVCFSENCSFDVTANGVGREISSIFGLKVVNSRKLLINFKKNVESVNEMMIKFKRVSEYFEGDVDILQRGFWFIGKGVLYWLSPKAEFIFYQNMNLGMLNFLGGWV